MALSGGRVQNATLAITSKLTFVTSLSRPKKLTHHQLAVPVGCPGHNPVQLIEHQRLESATPPSSSSGTFFSMSLAVSRRTARRLLSVTNSSVVQPDIHVDNWCLYISKLTVKLLQHKNCKWRYFWLPGGKLLAAKGNTRVGRPLYSVC